MTAARHAQRGGDSTAERVPAWWYALHQRYRLTQCGLVDNCMSYATALLLDAMAAEWPRAVSEVGREEREEQKIRETTDTLRMMRGL